MAGPARAGLTCERSRNESVQDMAGSPSAQDVADVLAMTLEREDASGGPWCPPGDAMALRRWVTDRSAPLGSGIRRVVRLARLMAMADGRDYVRFLYVRLTSLRARHFRHVIEAAFAERRIQPSVATLSDAGVHLHESALLPQEGMHAVFEIDFVQMPRLAALLDFLHNALGFTVVADLLAPLLQRGNPSRSANEVARALHAALNSWLSKRLESANHILQARCMRAFLANRGSVAPEAVDDEAILLFWTTMAEAGDDEQIDGFRLYRSTACAMLRYRYALRDAAAAKHLEDALERGWESAHDELATDRAAAQSEPWQSPLKALTSPLARRVKWFTGKELSSLLNYLGGPADEANKDTSEDSNGPDAWKGGLAGDERFDVALWLTLLRADVFGAAQASIVGRLRRRGTAREAVAQAMMQIDDAAYTTAASAYANLRQQLRLESLAALAALMETGATEAVILLDGLGGRHAVQAVIGPAADDETPAAGDEAIADALHGRIALALKCALADPSLVPDGAARTLLQEAIAATRKVSRVGFRREDRADPEMLAGLRAGAAAVLETAQELDRLTATLAQKAPRGDVAADRDRFAAAFRCIYLAVTGK
jgi:hypothetical protein